MEAGAIKATSDPEMRRRAGAEKRKLSTSFPGSAVQKRAPCSSHGKIFSRSALAEEALEKTYFCRSPDPFLAAQPKKR